MQGDGAAGIVESLAKAQRCRAWGRRASQEQLARAFGSGTAWPGPCGSGTGWPCGLVGAAPPGQGREIDSDQHFGLST
ncbi:hypothetical protein GUJ93_ZPchr0014g46642 [Zizania palustris]|uniref:Uncharacterized protein n=1 Tax=Zizania palustris TaxID=103762 RepID=A0A8J5VRZ2_ZIZPA|nr:hypothetical protein GUJ93_ZPchr0014g46642 [Zizania palustris]